MAILIFTIQLNPANNIKIIFTRIVLLFPHFLFPLCNSKKDYDAKRDYAVMLNFPQRWYYPLFAVIKKIIPRISISFHKQFFLCFRKQLTFFFVKAKMTRKFYVFLLIISVLFFFVLVDIANSIFFNCECYEIFVEEMLRDFVHWVPKKLVFCYEMFSGCKYLVPIEYFWLEFIF